MMKCMMCGKVYNTLYRINGVWYCYEHLPEIELENSDNSGSVCDLPPKVTPLVKSPPHP